MNRFVALILLLGAIQANAETISGRVVKVADGDTITILAGTSQHQISLIGIQAPEKNQPFANRSKQALANNVAGKTVEVEFSKRDSAQRIIGKVIYMGYDINLRQLELGMAWYDKQYEQEQDVEDRSKYAHAESVSVRDKVGLWSLPEYRAQRDSRK